MRISAAACASWPKWMGSGKGEGSATTDRFRGRSNDCERLDWGREAVIYVHVIQSASRPRTYWRKSFTLCRRPSVRSRICCVAAYGREYRYSGHSRSVRPMQPRGFCCPKMASPHQPVRTCRRARSSLRDAPGLVVCPGGLGQDHLFPALNRRSRDEAWCSRPQALSAASPGLPRRADPAMSARRPDADSLTFSSAVYRFLARAIRHRYSRVLNYSAFVWPADWS
jgi:hypothetical protein